MQDVDEPGETSSIQARWVQAAYPVAAEIEVVGATPAGRGYPARVRHANADGLRLSCAVTLSEGREVRISLIAPDGQPLSATGRIAHSAPRTGGAGGGCDIILIFDSPQPRLSITRIDRAA